MAKHEIQLKFGHEIPVGNVDVQMTVKADDQAFGRLKVSRGGIDWLPPGRSRKSFSLTWEQFAQLIQENGREKG